MNGSESERPARGLPARILGGLRVPAPRSAGTRSVALVTLSQLFVVAFRTKLLLTRMLLRGYIRLGAVMVRFTARSEDALHYRELTVREPDLLIAQRRLQRFVSRILLTKLAIAIVALFATLSYTNPYTPPGFEGYVYEQPRIIGAGGFKGTQIGPANFGISFWRNKVINIDIRPEEHPEQFTALTSDDLAVALHVTAVLSIVRGNIAEVVESDGGEDWYARFIQPHLRSLVDAAVERRSSGDLKHDLSAVETEVRTGLGAYLAGTPFVLRDLAATDIAYPKAVDEAVQRKLAARQLLEEKRTQLEIARADAQIRVVAAQGESDAQRIIGQTLTPMLLQHEEIDAQMKGASSPSRTTVYIPTSPGGIPIIEMPQHEN
jgi:regulator of protease activity HflC (stomatin/prohibitin superfamily)